jgi:flagella basal body P-ring formation protein FlgA
MRVELAQRRFTLTAATGDFAPFEVRAARLDKRDGSFVATLAVREGLDLATEIELRGAAYRAIRIPMLARPMRPGQVVVEDDIAWVETRAGALDSATVFESEGLIGRTPRTALRAGEPLRRTDLVLPVIVSRGDMVTMVLATPTMTLTAKGRATENGAEGQTIKVQNTRSKATVEAVVAGPNRVVVTSPSLAMHQP